MLCQSSSLTISLIYLSHERLLYLPVVMAHSRVASLYLYHHILVHSLAKGMARVFPLGSRKTQEDRILQVSFYFLFDRAQVMHNDTLLAPLYL